MEYILLAIIGLMTMYIAIDHDPRNPKNQHFPNSTKNETESAEKTPDAI